MNNFRAIFFYSYVIINMCSFFLYGVDKYRSLHGKKTNCGEDTPVVLIFFRGIRFYDLDAFFSS